MEQITCEKCGGQGWHWVQYMTANEDVVESEDSCEPCNGTGYITKDPSND